MSKVSSVPQFGITRSQARCLDFIRQYRSAHPHAPSYREIAGGLGLKSISQVALAVTGLEERGRIARIPGSARSLIVLDQGGAA